MGPVRGGATNDSFFIEERERTVFVANATAQAVVEPEPPGKDCQIQ